MKTKKLLIAVLATISIATVSMAQTIPGYVPTSGLIGWWPFNGNANDESGNGNNGIVNGAILTIDRNGKNLSAYSFNGLSNYIILPKNIGQFGTSSFTVSAWFKTSSSNTEDIVRFDDGYGASLWLLRLDKNGCLNAGVTNNAGVASNDFLTTKKYNDNIWHLATYIRDINSNKWKFFIDGFLYGSVEMIAIDNILGKSTTVLRIGSLANTWEFFNGSIDDVIIWNRALSDKEIALLYQGCNLSFTTQPSNQSVGINSNAIFNIVTSSQSATYQWQTNSANLGWQNIPANSNYSGVNTSTLTVKNIQMSNHNQPFRAIAIDGTCIDTSSVALIKVVDTCLVSVSDTLIVNAKLSGLTPPNNSTNIKMYPNPAKDYLIVDLDNYTSMSGYTIVISNSLGQSVSSTLVNKRSTNISLSILGNKGIFLVQIKDTQSKPIVTKKLLIQ
jgi:hypothetical protein